MTVGKEIVKTRGKNQLFLNSLFKRVISGECAFSNDIIQSNFTTNVVDILEILNVKNKFSNVSF